MTGSAWSPETTRVGQATARRVLVIAPTPFFGDRGCHVRIYEEVRGLASLGIRSCVVTYPDGRDLPNVEIIRARALPGVRAKALGPSFARPVLDAGLLWAAHREIRRMRPHLIHGHLHEGIAIGTVLRAWHRLPLVADLQGSLTAELVDHGSFADPGPIAPVSRAIERWLVHRPDRIITSSSQGCAMLAAQGVPSKRVSALPDGVDLDVFRPGTPDSELVGRLALDGKRVVVFLGVLTAYQGVDLLIDAAARVVVRAPDVRFLLVGYPNEERYRAIVRERGLADTILLPGRVPYADAPRWLRLGHVAVSLKQSLTEANGKLLNYMGCGLPVVASDTPVNRELLGEGGVYTPVGDVDAVATQLLRLLDDRDLRQARGAGMRQRADDLYSWPVLARRLASVYETTLDGAPS